MDGLVDASKEPFVHCYECPMPFCGSPADMVHHLTDACSGHCWPLAENIKYETCYPFTMPESLEDRREREGEEIAMNVNVRGGDSDVVGGAVFIASNGTPM